MPRHINILVSQPQNNNLGSSLNSLFEVLTQLHSLSSGDTLTINLQNITFAYPSLFLPLSAMLKRLRLQNLDIQIINNSCTYLNTVYFPQGLDPLLGSNWQSDMNYYKNRSYLPICSIPIANMYMELRDNLISTFEQILRRQLNLSGQMQSSISYLISEAFDNIVEHAEIENGWIMVQNYPSLNFLDVCIADTGRGILGSYQNMAFDDIATTETALQEAINGRSTKIHETSRGYGIRTSRRMLVNGLHGIYFLMSGNSFYYWSQEHESIHTLDPIYSWPGSIVVLRIPKTEPSGFNYVNYLE